MCCQRSEPHHASLPQLKSIRNQGHCPVDFRYFPDRSLLYCRRWLLRSPLHDHHFRQISLQFQIGERRLDRKSTRLNSSHVAISYAVFCLKKKKNMQQVHTTNTTTEKATQNLTAVAQRQ